MPSIKIYKIPVVVDLTLMDHGIRNNSMPYRQSDFKVYKSSFNPIEFIVRDSDRRPVDLTNKDVTITVVNFYTENVIFQKSAEIITPEKGRIRVTFEPHEIAEWESGHYKYSLMITNEDTTNNLLAVDQNHEVTSYFDFVEGVLPEPRESIKAIGEEFTPINIAPPTTEPTIFVS